EVEMARVRAALADVRNADLPEFARFFGCPAEFGRAVDKRAASDMLEVSDAAVTAPLLTADPTLLKAFEPFCDVGAKARRTASNTLRAAVEKEVEKLLPHGKAQKRTVAKALAMSTRTLARRLAVQETTYEEVVDQLRCGLALQYLKDPGMSLSQIAWQLGYEESSSFNHAFRRWTGRSPSEVRKRKSLPAAALGLTAGQTTAMGVRSNWPKNAEDWHAGTSPQRAISLTLFSRRPM